MSPGPLSLCSRLADVYRLPSELPGGARSALVLHGVASHGRHIRVPRSAIGNGPEFVSPV